jgi:hypothetical protein
MPDVSIDLKQSAPHLALLLREELSIPKTLDAEKLVDFSMLPSAR